MGTFEIIAVLVTLAATFSWLNHRFVGLPTTVGVMAFGLVASLALLAAGGLGLPVADAAEGFVASIPFHTTLLRGMLGLLLFAGALHVDLSDLRREAWMVGVLATLGVLVSTVAVGGLVWVVLETVGLPLPLIDCLLFGALISPTDPIAVLAILKTIGAPKRLSVQMAGESLFNDGVGVVVFLVLLEVASGTGDTTPGAVAALFLQETVGGAAFGLAAGYVAFRMLASVDNYQVEVLVTLALVTGGYAVANALHLSGAIAMVVAGLLIGNRGRAFAMSATTREHLDTFWELIDEILNAVLFVLLGLELLAVGHGRPALVAGACAIPAVLLARFASVGLPVVVLRWRGLVGGHAIKVLTWGGLRGGISVALALSLPPGHTRSVLLPVTYVVVVFSILVQGLTIGPLVRRLLGGR